MSALSEVLENQKSIAMTEETIGKVEQAIREQQEKIIAESVAVRADLYEKKADILAEMAVGKADAGDLAAIDVEISRHEEATKAAEKKIGPARAAVDGLTRRLQQEQDTKKKLTNAREQARQTFLLDQAEQAGAKCRELADAYHAAFARLTALDMMTGSGLVSQSTRYVLPNLRLAAYADIRDHETLHDISEIAGAGRAEVHLVAERKRIADMGIEL